MLRTVYSSVVRLFGLLPKWLNLLLMEGSAKALRVTAVGYTGQNGEFFGALDHTIMGGYIKSRAVRPRFPELAQKQTSI